MEPEKFAKFRHALIINFECQKYTHQCIGFVQNVPWTTTNLKRILLPVVPDVQIIHIQSVPQVTTSSSVHVILDMKDPMEAHVPVRIFYCLVCCLEKTKLAHEVPDYHLRYQKRNDINFNQYIRTYLIKNQNA